MQQQVRIITTKEGYDEIMIFIRAYNNKKLTKNIVNDVTCQYYNDIYFFRWDNPKYFKFLKYLIKILVNKNVTYRICIIDKGHIELYENTVLEDECKDIAMPMVICEFDDKETIKMLKQFNSRGDNNGI